MRELRFLDPELTVPLDGKLELPPFFEGSPFREAIVVQSIEGLELQLNR